MSPSANARNIAEGVPLRACDTLPHPHLELITRESTRAPNLAQYGARALVQFVVDQRFPSTRSIGEIYNRLVLPFLKRHIRNITHLQKKTHEGNGALCMIFRGLKILASNIEYVSRPDVFRGLRYEA